jgi:hypothetical protein
MPNHAYKRGLELLRNYADDEESLALNKMGRTKGLANAEAKGRYLAMRFVVHLANELLDSPKSQAALPLDANPVESPAAKEALTLVAPVEKVEKVEVTE